MEEINLSHQYQWVMDQFADACKESIGIKPLEDNRLVLNAAVNFGAYIQQYKRLDQSTSWHQSMISSMIKAKVDTLSRRIQKEYGTHEEYLSRVRQRSSPRTAEAPRNSQRVAAQTQPDRVKFREAYVRSGASSPDSSKPGTNN
jgi:hypothetical protein